MITDVVADAVDVSVSAAQQLRHPVRRDLTARSANVQPSLRSNPATSPDTYSATRRRGAARPNRPPTSEHSLSS